MTIGLQTITKTVIFAAVNLKEFFLKLSEAEQERFAKTAGTTVGYLRAHILPRRKMPRPALMEGLVTACQQQDPAVSRVAVIRFFYEEAAA